MANNFSNDADCVAVWNLESGALGVDSKGANTLTNNGVTADIATFKQGAASGDFELSEADRLSITDAALDAGFPLKSGDSNKKISACGWFRPESLPASTTYLLAKYSTTDNKRSVAFTVAAAAQFRLAIGHTGGTAFESITMDTLTMVTGNWYHWAFTYDDATRAYRIRCRQDGQAAIELTGNFTNQISVTDAPFTLGAYGSGVSFSDGLIDEVVVFKDILTSDEIDQIYAGTYGAALSAALAGALPSPLGSLSIAVLFHEALTADMPGPSGSISKKIGKSLSGSLPSMAGGLSNKIGKMLSGGVPEQSGGISTIFSVDQSVSGIMPAPSGSLATVLHIFTGTLENLIKIIGAGFKKIF